MEAFIMAEGSAVADIRGRRMGTFVGDLLVVDDEPDACELLRRLLSGSGYQVRVAESGAVALAMMREGIPGLVLLDAMMPGLDGMAVLSRMASDAELAGIPVVIVTAIDPDRYRTLLDRGARRVIPKGEVRETVLQIVREVVGVAG